MVIIYSLETCPFCVELKSGLEKAGIPYEVKDIKVPKFEAEYNKIADFANTESIPVMLINKQVFVPDVSFTTIGEAVELAKKFNQA